jgi:DNA invertase Pin-like site-specific DNA recombinase
VRSRMRLRSNSAFCGEPQKAEFERNLIRERTLAGLKAARARGRNGGRPKKLSPKELKTIRTLLRSNEVPVQDIAAQFKVNRSTLYRNVTAVP